MEIKIPAQFNTNSMYSLISEIERAKKNLTGQNIILDFQTLNFIRASGTTILHNIIQWLIADGISVSFKLPDLKCMVATNNNPIKYLDDTGFFEYYLQKKIFENSRRRPSTIPIKNICTEDYYDWIENVLIDWLKNLLDVQESSGFSGLQTCIGEIFNNIKDHSGRNIGCAFAQYYPKEYQIQIAISDFGVGIPYNVKTNINCNDDARALELSIQEGFTTKSVPTNRGAGLENLIGFVISNNGQIKIYSCKGQLKCYSENGRKIIDSRLSSESFPGTLFLIRLNTNSIYQELCKEDFSW